MLRFGKINGIAATIFAILAFVHSAFGTIPWLAFLFLGMGWLTVTIIGSFHIRWNYHLKSLHSNADISENQMALTFDDGPHPDITPKVLALLKEFDAKATFFCIGKNAEAYPDLIKKIITAGHTVGNHTYSHSNCFGFFGTKKVIVELQKCNTIIEEISGRKLKLYRPAFGVTNPNIKKAVEAARMQPIGWNVRSLDTTNRTKKKILKRITGHLSNGDIILMHDTSSKTIAVLEQLLLFLKEKKLQSVTVDQLFNIEAYA